MKIYHSFFCLQIHCRQAQGTPEGAETAGKVCLQGDTGSACVLIGETGHHKPGKPSPPGRSSGGVWGRWESYTEAEYVLGSGWGAVKPEGRTGSWRWAGVRTGVEQEVWLSAQILQTELGSKKHLGKSDLAVWCIGSWERFGDRLLFGILPYFRTD
jgi:hypothetical protein